MLKTCKTCGRDLPATEEYYYKQPNVKSGLFARCIECIKLQSTTEEFKKHRREIRDKNIDKKRELAREWYNNNKDSCRASARKYASLPKHQIRIRRNNYKKKFNITEEDIVLLTNKQKGCCAICKESLVFPDSEKHFAVDHNHNTGKVRGLLCETCNRGLGLFSDSVDNLEEAVSYLRTHNGR